MVIGLGITALGKFAAAFQIVIERGLTVIDIMQEWQSHPDVLYANSLVTVGQKVTSVQDGMPTWVAELMVRRPTVQDAIEFITHIEASLEIPIV